MQAQNTAKLCECGCGEPTSIAVWSNTARGWIKGQPIRFKAGHNGRQTPEERLARFWGNVDKTDGCWLYVGLIDKALGYGRINFNGREWLTHRLAYTLEVGPIPEGLDLDHICRVRHCVNPAHLEPVTRGENIRRGARGGRVTHCVNGHEYTPENTYVYRGYRCCRQCKRLSERNRPTTLAGRKAAVGVPGAWGS